MKIRFAPIIWLAVLVAASASAGSAAPRRAHPDFSGYWAAVPTEELFNALRINRFGMPLNAEYEAKWAARMAAAKAGRPYADAAASCLPYGMPRVMYAINSVIQILQTAHEIVMLSGESSEFRHIYIDGRPHPSDPDPSFQGHSIGHFDGDTLVIDTIAIKTGLPAETGEEHSDAMHVTERLRRISASELDYLVTAVDPKAFTAPWVQHWRYKAQSEPFEWVEYVCQENNRNPPDADGRQTIKITGGPLGSEP